LLPRSPFDETAMKDTNTTKSAASRHRVTRLAIATSLLLIASLTPIFDGEAVALDRDAVLEFLPPSGSEVDGYRVYVMDDATRVVEDLDIGFVPPDADGVARSVLVLDAASSYRVNMTAYNAAGESAPSNQILYPAEACEPSLCDDGDACTSDSCGAAGCVSVRLPDGTACDDGYVDTVDDRCVAGICEGIVLACTGDLDCDDGDVCNGTESCEQGRVCLGGVPLDCGEATQCAEPACDAREGCLSVTRPDGTPCDDGRAETSGDRCLSGVCQAGDEAGLAVHSVAPDVVSPGLHTIEIRGMGFGVGVVLSFENGKGRPPRVESLGLVDATTLEARIAVSRKGTKRDRLFDVVAHLPRALRVTP
jgi:hypothetical protein